MADSANVPGCRDPEKVLSWKNYFMALAVLSAKRSKDPKCQVGAVIIDDNLRIVGLGYNGLPDGRDDSSFWKQPVKNEYFKKNYVCHAELNAILNSRGGATNCIMYVTRFPCHECAKLIIQSGIRKVVFLKQKSQNDYSEICAKEILENVQERKDGDDEVKVKGHKVEVVEFQIDDPEADIKINFRDFIKENFPDSV